eukprot:10595762-Karenia_brevis.AAC.1
MARSEIEGPTDTGSSKSDRRRVLRPTSDGSEGAETPEGHSRSSIDKNKPVTSSEYASFSCSGSFC